MDQSIPAPVSDNPPDAPERLATVERETGPAPTHCVIWLHGLGADGHDCEPIVPELGLRDRAVRFVFPHAPERPVTINAGMRMRAWYDIRSISASRDQDEAGIAASARQVHALIDRERQRGMAASQIVLAGFSQGGAMAMHVALRYPERLAGLLSLSAYLLFPERLPTDAHAANRDLPVFMGHGTMDPVVPFAMGREAAKALLAGGWPVSFHEYPLPHSVSMPEIRDVGEWLRSTLSIDEPA